MALALDMPQTSQWQPAVAAILQAHGRLNILVNNVGVYQRRGLEKIGEQDWVLVFDVNAKGVFLGAGRRTWTPKLISALSHSLSS